jgi:hypothetical protein
MFDRQGRLLWPESQSASEVSRSACQCVLRRVGNGPGWCWAANAPRRKRQERSRERGANRQEHRKEQVLQVRPL